MRAAWRWTAVSVLWMGVCGGMCAQISNPDNMVSGPPKAPHTRAHAKAQDRSVGDLQWMWQYAQPTPNGNAVTLRADPRFSATLDRAFVQPQAFWGKSVPLSAVIPRFLDRYGAVNTRDNRYLTVDGCVPSFCAAHGLLWADLGQRSDAADPLMIFAAVDWTTEAHTTDQPNADYNLWIFPSRHLDADGLPLGLVSAIADWDARLATAHRGVPHIAHALLVEPDGQPFALQPKAVGANTLPPQPDTTTPRTDDDQ